MKQVLIVDDEIRLLQSIEAGFSHCRDLFKVITAANGLDAVEILQREKIDLVVTDLRMPEMDGFELLAHISSISPFLPSIVMTAFATEEIEERLNNAGYTKLLEKPIDIERLAEAIKEGLAQESKEGSVAGFSLASFLQLLSMEKKTSLLCIDTPDTQGYLYLDRGEICAAICGEFRGEEAVYRMLIHESVRITFKKLPSHKVKKTINKPLMSLLMQGMRKKDELLEKQQSEVASEFTGETDLEKNDEDNSAQQVQQDQLIDGELNMGQIEDSLAKLSDVEGFMAVGIFTPNGEMAAQVNAANVKLAEIGSLANDVLLKAQKATDVMDVGRGQQVHVEAPKAHIIARCLNENEDFAATTAGKAHLHMILLIKKDGNLAMAKIKMESIIHEVAAAFR